MNRFSSSVLAIAPASLRWVGPLLLSRAEIARVPTGIPGVYLLHQFARRLGGYPVFYAGKSTDLRRRLTEHRGEWTKPSISALRAQLQTCFSAAPVPEELLNRVEAGLIRGLRPPCNDCVPTANPIFVNLPPLRLSSF